MEKSAVFVEVLKDSSPIQTELECIIKEITMINRDLLLIIMHTYRIFPHLFLINSESNSLTGLMSHPELAIAGYYFMTRSRDYPVMLRFSRRASLQAARCPASCGLLVLLPAEAKPVSQTFGQCSVRQERCTLSDIRIETTMLIRKASSTAQDATNVYIIIKEIYRLRSYLSETWLISALCLYILKTLSNEQTFTPEIRSTPFLSIRTAITFVFAP